MKKDGRYDVSSLAEAQFKPGSNEQGLRNRLGIKSSKEMDDVEARALERTMLEHVGMTCRLSSDQSLLENSSDGGD